MGHSKSIYFCIAFFYGLYMAPILQSGRLIGDWLFGIFVYPTFAEQSFAIGVGIVLYFVVLLIFSLLPIYIYQLIMDMFKKEVN